LNADGARGRTNIVVDVSNPKLPCANVLVIDPLNLTRLIVLVKKPPSPKVTECLPRTRAARWPPSRRTGSGAGQYQPLTESLLVPDR
jgi:hypothetical protein